jgi:O-antigen ligase
MVTLPLMLLVLASVRQPTWPRRAAVVGAVIAATVLGWAQLDSVQQRFAEGVAELRAYESQGEVATSWGMRLRMYEVTAAMVRERPLAGHGAGSWVSLWRERVSSDGKLGRHTAPHQEYLLVATQGGAVAIALLLAAMVAALRAAQRAGRDGHALLLVLVTLVVAGLFNVVLRDAKFALPLLTLAVLAGAVGRSTRSGPGA